MNATLVLPDEDDSGAILTEELEDWPGWVVRYRMLEDPSGELVVAELVVHFQGKDREGKNRPIGQVPLGGLPTRALRAITTDGALTTARDIIRVQQQRAPLKMNERLLRAGLLAVARDGADTVRRHSDSYYAGLAARYVAHRSDRRPYAELADELASSGISLAPETLRDHVREARRRGLLTHGPPGKAGGALTEKAKALLAASAGDDEVRRKRREVIVIRDPVTHITRLVTTRAFELRWRPIGWKIVREPREERE